MSGTGPDAIRGKTYFEIQQGQAELDLAIRRRKPGAKYRNFRQARFRKFRTTPGTPGIAPRSRRLVKKMMAEARRRARGAQLR